MSEERILVNIEDGVAEIRLNRPEKRNALDGEQARAVVMAGISLQERSDIRAMVLSGEGESFCAGLDFSRFSQMQDRSPGSRQGASRQDPLKVRELPSPGQMVGMVWKQIPVPVIAAVHGAAYGGGLQLALGADIRLAHPNSQLSVREIHWGLVPDMSLTQTLRDLVRMDVAKELMYSGRVVEAEEALQLGLVTRICQDPRAEALAMARLIANRSPEAVRAAKHLVENSWHADADTGLRLELDMQRTVMGKDNMKEAIRANFEKRPPRFADVPDGYQPVP